MPGVARKNYDEATQKRIPAVQQYFENSKLTATRLSIRKAIQA
jgi:hypothetical protein